MNVLAQAAAVAIVLGLIVFAAAWVVGRRSAGRAVKLRGEAVAAFEGQRPVLQERFLSAAAATGKPRGLRWTSCRLEGPTTMAIDRANGQLHALVAATVTFEAVAGGGMEDVEAVGNVRAATAVFVHRQGQWTTDGRAVFNLDPAGVLQHYGASLDPVEVTA
ncbi:MAG TPA: hypothetical protein PJ982_04520 [Lacipirellulaceae bacterium]|nr:hypothetical protein [Lacipirellulaceae bacterium]